jgi:ectoine hydroxylase-related dioxygenase (phytanoyl-CoA dioxygenase family)
MIQTTAEPGDAVIFHPRAIHCAYGSSPHRARRTLTIRFMGEAIRWLPKNRVFHPWMRELGLKKGDREEASRLPVVWDGSGQKRYGWGRNRLP